MKILDTPRSGKCGQTVAFQSRFGLCLRQHVPQKAALTPARERVCAAFGNNSRKWSARLSEEQRDRWTLAGAQVMSHPRLAQKGPLTGQQCWQAISTVRAVVGLPETLEVPARPVFSLSKVGQLVIENGADGVRLYLAVSGELNEDIMVFGQEPCSRGRYQRRNVSYLGLLPPPIGGLSEITGPYKARFGEPRPGQKVFLVTCQEKDGWKGLDLEASATVPERPQDLQAIADPAGSQFIYMHTGCTGDAEGIAAPVVSPSQASAETGHGGGDASGTPLEQKKAPEGEGDAPVWGGVGTHKRPK
ncbi:MAG: hypothetical protein ACLQU3_01295 [Limisphaerales bacterium]